MSWLLLLLACREPTIEVIPGVSASLEVVVTNPTSCATCDGFADIDTLRLDVSVAGVVVASDTFAYPDEAVTLPDLTSFGVVRVSLFGLADGRVLSVGRTAEIVLMPDAEQSVPLVFLPVNRALALDAPMATDRSRHLVLSRRDGTVLLVGGLDPAGQRATSTTELFDPALGTFDEFEPYPSGGMASPVVAPLPGGASLLVGGYAVLGGAPVAIDHAVVFDDDTGTFTQAAPLTQGRSGHCVAMFRERQGLVLGGAPGAADALKHNDETGEWSFTELTMHDLDTEETTGCAATSNGAVYVQGRGPLSTGVWDGGWAGADPSEAFTAAGPGGAGDARYVEGASFFPTEDGGMRVLGGADVESGEVASDGRLYAPDVQRFTKVEGFAAPRFDTQVAPWIAPGWYAAGCGWTDATRTEGEATLELFAPGDEAHGPPIQLDRARPGCGLSVLRDGSILVTGGYEVGGASAVDAALVVPYIDPAMTAE